MIIETEGERWLLSLGDKIIDAHALPAGVLDALVRQKPRPCLHLVLLTGSFTSEFGRFLCGRLGSAVFRRRSGLSKPFVVTGIRVLLSVGVPQLASPTDRSTRIHDSNYRASGAGIGSEVKSRVSPLSAGNWS